MTETAKAAIDYEVALVLTQAANEAARMGEALIRVTVNEAGNKVFFEVVSRDSVQDYL
jgi:hypothetical protein